MKVKIFQSDLVFNNVFISRRILEENEPDYYSGKFFFFVRPQNVCVVDTFYRTTKVLDRQTGSAFKIVQRVPPFSNSIFIVRYKTGRDYRVPPLSFFRHCATFLEIFFYIQRVPPSNFSIFYSKLKFRKAQRVSPFKFFGTIRLKILILRFFVFFFRKFFNISKGSRKVQFLKYFAT